MFELFVELSKKHSLKGNAKSSTLFQYFLLGPLLLVATLTLALFKLYLSSVWDNIWTIGFTLSLALGLTIIVLSLKEGAHHLSDLVKNQENSEEKSLQLQQQVDALKLIVHQEKEQATQTQESLRSQLKESEKRAESFEELNSIKKYEWEALEEEKEALFQENVSTQQDLVALKAENSRLAEQLTALHDETNNLRDELANKQELPPSHHPYEELRKQFDEKCNILNATRKDLFAMEGKYLTVQKEMENRLLEPHSEIQGLLKQFNELEAYCGRLEDDLTRHQELLTELSVKKPVRTKRKTVPKKVKVNEAVVADLFTDTPKKKAKAK